MTVEKGSAGYTIEFQYISGQMLFDDELMDVAAPEVLKGRLQCFFIGNEMYVIGLLGTFIIAFQPTRKGYGCTVF